MTTPDRQDIKDRVEQGEQRHRARTEATLLDRAGETAIEAKDRFTAFAREHPLTTVAAAVAAGVLISGMFPRSPTRRLGRRAAGLAAIGAEVAASYVNQARDAARPVVRSGADRLDVWSDSLGETLSHTARRLRREASHLADSAGESARHARTQARIEAQKVASRIRRGH